MTQEFVPAISGVKIFPDGRMRAQDAAAYLGLSYKALANQRTHGVGPTFSKVGKFVFYRKDDLDAWLDSCRTASTVSFRARREVAVRGAAASASTTN